jgi:hypothetical protein
MAKSKSEEKTKPVGPKARNDAYVMMLFITLIAIITGSVLMYLDNEEYGKNPPPKEPQISNISRLGEAPSATGPAGKGDAKEAPKDDGKGMP